MSQGRKINIPTNNKQKLQSLYAKGGIMLFSIERPNRLYKGTIMLSPVENCYQRRVVHVREYGYNDNLQGEREEK